MYKRDKFKIIIVAPKPPPFGGVVIHVSRLVSAIKQKGYHVEWIDLSKKRSFPEAVRSIISSLLQSSTNVVHLHTWGNDWRKIALLSIIRPFVSRLLATWHMVWSEDVRRIVFSLGIHSLLKFSFNQYDKWLVLNRRVSDELKDFGVKNSRISIVSAFLCPNEPPVQIPPNVNQFVTKHSPCLLLPATTMRWHNGQELYGVSFAISALPKIKQQFTNAGLIVLFANPQERNIIEQLQHYAKQLGVRDSMIIVQGVSGNLKNFYQASDVILRPTVTDGDSLSVKEALYFTKPVVASDVVPRPEGCVVYRALEIESFVSAVFSALESDTLVLQKVAAKLKQESEDLINFILTEYGVE